MVSLIRPAPFTLVSAVGGLGDGRHTMAQVSNSDVVTEDVRAPTVSLTDKIPSAAFTMALTLPTEFTAPTVPRAL